MTKEKLIENIVEDWAVNYEIPFRIWEIKVDWECIWIGAIDPVEALKRYENMIGYSFEPWEYNIEECDYRKSMYYEFADKDEYNKWVGKDWTTVDHHDKPPQEWWFKRVYRQVREVLQNSCVQITEPEIIYQTLH